MGEITKVYHRYLREVGYTWTSTESKEQMTDFGRCLEMMSILPIQPKYTQPFNDALHTLQQDLGLRPSGDYRGKRLDVVADHSSLLSSCFAGVAEYADAEELDVSLRHGALRRAP